LDTVLTYSTHQALWSDRLPKYVKATESFKYDADGDWVQSKASNDGK
jgi:hypothetical protein